MGVADLRSAKNVRPSRCYARMPLRNYDLWSRLRADYTGSWLMFMSIFLAPLALKTAGLVALNRVQVETAERVALVARFGPRPVPRSVGAGFCGKQVCFVPGSRAEGKETSWGSDRNRPRVAVRFLGGAVGVNLLGHPDGLDVDDRAAQR